MNSFEEELQMVRGMEKSMGKTIGIYPEIKNPLWHRQQGKNISILALQMLKNYNYTSRTSKCFLQSFDAAELLEIRQTIFPSLQMNLPLVQLLPYKPWATYRPKTMTEIAIYAQGIGPNKYMIIFRNSTVNNLHMSSLVQKAHAANLVVHPWTFRSDQMPGYATDFNQLLEIFFKTANVDGVFSDFPDKVVRFLASPSSITSTTSPSITSPSITSMTSPSSAANTRAIPQVPLVLILLLHSCLNAIA